MSEHCICFLAGADVLLGKIIVELQHRHGDGAVIADPSPSVLFDLLWSETRFAVRRASDLPLVIAMPETVRDKASWDLQLQAFYDQVVVPIADHTGGTAVAITLPGNETWTELLERLFPYSEDNGSLE
jgi:hypothetical protein